MTESRPYKSKRRQIQAESTRREILSAARWLFAERGYTPTTLDEIAAKAGVSVPTLYTSVGSKAKIARALIEFVNEEADIPENDRRQRAATTGPELIRANVHLTRVLNERCGDIIRAIASASASDPEVLPALEVGRDYHREGEYEIARRLSRMGALRSELGVEDAGAILSTMTSYEVWHLYVTLEGWSYDRVESWLVDSLIEMLVTPGVP